MGICTHANKTKGTFARFSTCSKWGQCSCRVQTMFSPCVAIICRKWVGSNLITIPSYVATVYPHVIKSHQKSDPNQARYRRMNWQCRHVGNLGTWVYHLSAGNSPTIYQFYMKLSPGYTDGMYIYIYIIHIYIYNYAYVCICFWVINMYKPSSDWDAPPSMADSSAI